MRTDSLPDGVYWPEPEAPEEIARQIHAVVLAIEKAEAGAPADAGITHFGLGMTIGTEDIGISNRGSLLQITVYRKSGQPVGARTEPYTCPTCAHIHMPPSYQHPGYSKGTHDKRMRALAEAFGVKVREHWNGCDGHNGISIVLARDCPKTLLAAIQRGPTSPVDYGDWVKEITGGAAS